MPKQYWHFVKEDRRLGFDDKRLVVPGETLAHVGPLELCKSGLHASHGALDALSYAPGPVVCRVTLGGKIIEGDDKSVASRRTVIWVADATDTLRKFARLCALDVIHLWDAPEIVARYLKTGDESIRTAARDAAWGAARGAAGVATRDAAWVAARTAAWVAARTAAWVAARDAARDAAWERQGARLHKMLLELRP